MIMRAWDEPHGFTDLDMGITDADVAGETLSVTVWPDGGGCWCWELLDAEPSGFDGFGRIVWCDVTLDGGTADTQAEAESAGEAAKESYIRDLIRK